MLRIAMNTTVSGFQFQVSAKPILIVVAEPTFQEDLTCGNWLSRNSKPETRNRLSMHSAGTRARLVLSHQEGQWNHHPTNDGEDEDHIVISQRGGLLLHPAVDHVVGALRGVGCAVTRAGDGVGYAFNAARKSLVRISKMRH